MTYEELIKRILEICPKAMFLKADRGNELVIATGWVYIEGSETLGRVMGFDMPESEDS